MRKAQPLWVFLLIASLSAITAIAVERSILGGSNDKLDRNILALQQQLAQSQAQRDSLNTLLASHQDTLRMLISEEHNLMNNLDILHLQLDRQDSIINHLRIQSPGHEITTDSLLDDLNAIARTLYTSNGTASNAH